MYLYDEAHALARAIRESEEMKALVAAKKELDADEGAREIVRDFLAKQLNLEYRQMLGKEQDEKLQEEFREMSVLVANNQLAARYLAAFGRWQQIAADVQKIVADAMNDGMPDLSGLPGMPEK